MDQGQACAKSESGPFGDTIEELIWHWPEDSLGNVNSVRRVGHLGISAELNASFTLIWHTS